LADGLKVIEEESNSAALLKTGRGPASKFGEACSAKHLSFDIGKCYGCTKYLDVTAGGRVRVPRDSKEFKETFEGQRGTEQYYFRQGDREVGQIIHYAFRTLSNQLSGALVEHGSNTSADRFRLLGCPKVIDFCSAQPPSLSGLGVDNKYAQRIVTGGAALIWSGAVVIAARSAEDQHQAGSEHKANGQRHEIQVSAG